ncbi:MAG: hypothetical protein FD130_440, partial [Halothiobacillaceae bacterium]
GMVGGCRTRDIGLGGVYLEAGSGLLESGETVELLFKLPSASSEELHTLRAKVVRITEGGAGLMFRDFDAIAFRSLQKVMRARGAAL